MLSVEEMKEVLTKPKNALCKQYKQLFTASSTDFKTTAEALQEVAIAACKRNSGARGLRSILELLLQDALYEVRHTEACIGRGYWERKYRRRGYLLWNIISIIRMHCGGQGGNCSSSKTTKATRVSRVYNFNVLYFQFYCISSHHNTSCQCGERKICSAGNQQ